MVSFARSYKKFQKRKFGIASVSVDPPSHNRAMVGKLSLPFPLLSDPEGDLIKSLGLWNEEEGVSEPAIVVLDESGAVLHLYSGGKDFSDRPSLEELLGMLDDVKADGRPVGGEPEVSVSPAEAENSTVRPDRPAMTLEQLVSYYRGVFFTTVALKKKFDALGRKGKAPSKVVDSYQKLTNEYGAAIRETAG